MKRKNTSQDQKQKMPNDLQSTAIAALVPAKPDFTPTRDAVAKKAYFSYCTPLPPHPMTVQKGSRLGATRAIQTDARENTICTWTEFKKL
jgi:hypothetical protein